MRTDKPIVTTCAFMAVVLGGIFVTGHVVVISLGYLIYLALAR